VVPVIRIGYPIQDEMIIACDTTVGDCFDPTLRDPAGAAPGYRVGLEKDAA